MSWYPASPIQRAFPDRFSVPGVEAELISFYRAISLMKSFECYRVSRVFR